MKRRNYRLMEGAGDGGQGAGAGTGDGGQGQQAVTGAGAAAIEQPSGGDSQKTTQPWTQSIADEGLRQFVEGKGFKDVAEAAKALQELEGRYAVPKTADEYQLPVPQGDDGAFAKQAAGWMHEAGIPAAAAKQLAEKWNAFAASQVQAQQVAQQQAGEKAINELRAEWGGQYDANVELGRKAMRTFGVPPEVVDKLAGAAGDAQVIKVFKSIGAAMGESTLNPGASGSSNQQGTGNTMSDIASDLYGNSK